MIYIPYSFAGIVIWGRFRYMWPIVTSAVYHPYMYVYGNIYISADEHPPPTERVILSQPIIRFMGVIFDGNHDFEGLRSPKAHLDTVQTNLLNHLGSPFNRPEGNLQAAQRKFWPL